MKLSETVIWYTPSSLNEETAGQIELTKYGHEPTRYFTGLTGACYSNIHKSSSKEQSSWIQNLFVHLIARDGISPEVVHRAFCEIRQYRDALANDVPMPDHLKEKFQLELEGG